VNPWDFTQNDMTSRGYQSLHVKCRSTAKAARTSTSLDHGDLRLRTWNFVDGTKELVMADVDASFEDDGVSFSALLSAYCVATFSIGHINSGRPEHGGVVNIT
jgi:hypothetical protein